MIPEALKAEKRWIPIRLDKSPKISSWQNPENQLSLKAIDFSRKNTLKGFSINPGYALLDFDHVIDNQRNWFSKDAEDTFNYIQSNLDSYAEISMSGEGIHVLVKPTPNLNWIEQGIAKIQFNVGVLEIYYNTNRYVIITGKQISENSNITSGDKVDTVMSKLLEQSNKSVKNEIKELPKEATPIEGSDTHKEDKVPIRAVLAILNEISPDCSRKIWIECLWTCKQLGVPKAKFHEWSAKSNKYNPNELDYQWDKALYSSKWTINTLLYYANVARELLSLPNSAPGNAYRLLYKFQNRIKVITDTNTIIVYSNGTWSSSKINIESLYLEIYEYLRSIAWNHKSLLKAWGKHATFDEALAVFKGFTEVQVSLDKLNSYKHLLNVNNGVVNLFVLGNYYLTIRNTYLPIKSIQLIAPNYYHS